MKIIQFLLIVALIFSLAACKGNAKAEDKSPVVASSSEDTDVLEATEAHNDVKLPTQIDTGVGLEYDTLNRIVKFGEDTVAYHADGSVTISYDYGDVIRLSQTGDKISESYDEYTGDVLTYSDYSFIINSDGLIVQAVTLGAQDYVEAPESRTIVVDYVYQNGNIMSCTIERYEYDHGVDWKDSKKLTTHKSSEDVAKYEYDSKKAPFYNSATPKWLLHYLFGELSANQNNVTKIKYSGETQEESYYVDKTYKYTYDKDGFPTGLTIKKNVKGYVAEDEVYEMLYRGTRNIK